MATKKPAVTAPKIPATKVTSRYTPPKAAPAKAAKPTPPAVVAGYKALKAANPYGTLGPSPQRVAKVNVAMGRPANYGSLPPETAPDTGISDVPDYVSGLGGGGGGGYIEPYTGASSALLSSQSAEDLGAMSSSMTSKIRQALVDLGLTDVSQLDPGARQYVDQATLTAAGQNKYSLFGQIATASAKATAMQRARLAAQGMLASGALTKSMQDILDEAEQKRYAGVRTFSGDVGTLLSAYAERQRDWASRIAEARFQEAQYRAANQDAWSGGASDPTGRGWDSPERGARPGEWADLPVRVGWNPIKNSDAEYDMSGATKTDWGYIGPQGQRYDENGRVI